MTHRLNRKKTPVTLAASALASAVLLALAAPATAQDAAAANPTELDAVTVTGYRASVEKALDIKRSEKGMVDAVVAEDIANFPDLNLAESLQRIPGVTITRDAGEGRNISVRGLGPDFTRVRINGLEALTTVGGSDQSGGTNRSRGFDFNVFASDLFSQLIVRKTASADVEEGSLGATVDLRTARPFDYDGFTFAASGQGSFNDLSEKASPRAAALIADTWADGRFGGLLSVAYSERRVREEGSNTGRWYSASSNGGFSPSSPFTAGLADGVWHPYFPRYTLLEHDQKRLGVTASLQWKPTDNTEFALDALYSKIDTVRSEKYIEAISFAYSAQKQNMVLRDGYIDPTSGALLYGLFDGAGVRSEQRRDEWNTAFKQVSLSGEHRFSDAFKVNLLVGHSSSKHANPVQTTLIMDKANVSGYSYDFRDSVTHPTSITASTPPTPAAGPWPKCACARSTPATASTTARWISPGTSGRRSPCGAACSPRTTRSTPASTAGRAKPWCRRSPMAATRCRRHWSTSPAWAAWPVRPMPGPCPTWPRCRSCWASTAGRASTSCTNATRPAAAWKSVTAARG